MTAKEVKQTCALVLLLRGRTAREKQSKQVAEEWFSRRAAKALQVAVQALEANARENAQAGIALAKIGKCFENKAASVAASKARKAQG